ncbi:MAG: hypothetical protein L0Z50_05850 [Verrucomicrobiales bacterium]|nr:hypothetical protein [Verrucomicrobiales bacterium]
MNTKPYLIASLMLSAFPLSSHALTTTYDDRTAWESAVVTWADVDLDSQVAEFEILNGGDTIGLPQSRTLFFDQNLEGRQVPTSFGTWSGSNNPRVLLTDITTTDVVGTFNAPIPAFGLEMQPDIQDEFTMSLLLSDGSTLSQTVSGLGGAKFFGWVTTGGPSVVSMTLSLAAGPGDEGFAFGRMVQKTPDAGATWPLLALALLGMVGLRQKLAS